MKKALALILAALMLAPTFIACSENSENTDASQGTTSSAVSSVDNTTENEEETMLSDNLGEHNFDGYKFRISAGREDFAQKITADDYTGTPVIDAIRNSTIAIEDRFNCDISWYIQDGGYDTTIRSGDDAFDIAVSWDYTIYGLAQNGMFLNLYDFTQFDFSKPWWPKNITNVLDINGALFTSANYLSYQGLHWERALMVNKDLAEKLNYEIPYDTVREGNWTFDAMLTYVNGASRDMDGDGVVTGGSPRDYIGFVTGNGTGYCMQESFELSPYTKDADGNIVYAVNEEKIETFITKMRAFLATPDAYYEGSFGESFQNGMTLICYGQLGDAYDIYSDKDFTYGFLTVPKFDENQAEYINCCTDTPWGIPITVTGDQKDIVGTICEALSCRNYQTVLPAYFDVAMKSRLADSPDDAEMLQLIADTRTTSFSYAYDFPFKDMLIELYDNNQGVSSYIASKSKAAGKLLNKFVEKFEKIKENQKDA